MERLGKGEKKDRSLFGEKFKNEKKPLAQGSVGEGHLVECIY